MGAVVEEGKIVITDENGQTTEFLWPALEEVLVFLPQGEDRTPNIFLIAGEQSEFVPAAVRGREELLREILQRGELVLTQEAPRYRQLSPRR